MKTTLINTDPNSIFRYFAQIDTPVPTVLEIGCHDGSDTIRMAQIRALRWIGFEPDPRNVAACEARGLSVNACAIGDECGEMPFWASGGRTPEGQENWSASGSLCKPTLHLEAHPWCEFRETRVPVVTLDSLEIPRVDLAWIDVQGAQMKVIRGGRATLAERVQAVYIECHAAPLYEGEPSLEEIARALDPLGFVLSQWWPSDALFVRR